MDDPSEKSPRGNIAAGNQVGRDLVQIYYATLLLKIKSFPAMAVSDEIPDRCSLMLEKCKAIARDRGLPVSVFEAIRQGQPYVERMLPVPVVSKFSGDRSEPLGDERSEQGSSQGYSL